MIRQLKNNLNASVVVVCYNQLKTLRLLLASLQKQDFSGSYEIIVCDDGSSDQIFDFIQSTSESSSVPIRYVWQQHHNQRAGIARNNGMHLAQGEIIIFLDGDMIPAVDLVSRHYNLHSGVKKIVVGNRIIIDSESIDITKLSQVNFFSELLPYGLWNNANEKQIKWAQSNKPWKACYGCHFSVPSFPEIIFDENMVGWGGEDWELAARLYYHYGYIIDFHQDLIALEYQMPGISNNVYKRNQHEEIVQWLKNVVYFVDKFPEVDLFELFDGFRKFELDHNSNLWRVITNKKPEECLNEIVSFTRLWLKNNGIYDKK